MIADLPPGEPPNSWSTSTGGRGYQSDIHVDGQDRDRNSFAVAYRGHKTCPSWSFTAGKMERADLEALWARYGDDTTSPISSP